MTFPETRLTLIHRIAKGDDQLAWKQFLQDYWRPICLFATRIGNLKWEDAEDVASVTLELFSQKNLLQQWLATPEARFKTLVCAVVRNVVSNRVRSDKVQVRKLNEYAADWSKLASESRADDVSVFYKIWAEELLRSAVDAVMLHYHKEGMGDYFRVLHGRICDQLPVKEIASQLDLKVSDVDNYYRHARQQLTSQLQLAIRQEVERYSVCDNPAEAFHLEWSQLASFFEAHGGLEAEIRRAATRQANAV